MMVMSLDGATVGPDGKSGSLSCPADRRVLVQTRRLADVILVGASTIRAERYRPMRAKGEDAAERSRLGLAAAPVVAIVSASLDLPWDEPLFRESTMPVLVITTQSAAPDRLAIARQHAEVEVLPGSQCDPVDVIASLHRRGLHRITCEGGAILLAGIAGAGLLDELDLTIAPMLIGGGQVLTSAGALSSPVDLELVGSFMEDGFTFLRYLTKR
jgi:5-amino-6-(5-phosphoribosylamino)uracil reductase